MKDYQNDKYENFFLNLKVSREALVAFGEFTAEAVAAPDVAPLIAGHGAAVAAAVAKLREEMEERQGQTGGSQMGTGSETKAFAAFKTFLTATDKKVLGPYLYDHEEERAAFYPDKLSGLTQAPVGKRLTRLVAYTEALETAADDTVRGQGPTARALLTAYRAATATKTKARTALQQTIGELGPAAVVVAEALWDVDTAARYAHRRAPAQARMYFDFASLPGRTAAKKAVSPPTSA